MTFRLMSLPILVLLVAACLLVSQRVAAQADAAHPQAIGPTQSLAVALNYGEQHWYQVAVAQGQLLRLELSSAEVLVEITAPTDSHKPGYAMPKLGASGSFLYWPEKFGWQTIQVKRRGRKEQQGCYSLRVNVVAHPTADEVAQAHAQRQLAQLWALYYQETEASLREMITQGEAALKVWQRLSDRYHEAKAHYQLAEAYKVKEQFPTALEHFRQALSYFEAENIPKEQAIILTSIGQLYASLSDYPRAIEHYERALPLWSQGDEEMPINMVGWNLVNLGHTYRAYGEWGKAIEYYQRAYHCYEQFPQTSQIYDEQSRGFGIVKASLGAISLAQGDKQVALSYLKQAVAQFQQGKDAENEYAMYGRIGEVYSTLGEYEQACQYYEQALQHYGNTKSIGEATILNSYGNLYRLTGQPEAALAKLQQSLTICRQLGDRRGQALTLTNLGAVYAAQQQYQQALSAYGEAQELWKDIGDKYSQGYTLNYLGLAHYELKESAQARAFFNQALALRRATNDREGEANTLYNLARLDYDAGNWQVARQAIASAISLSEAVRATVASDELRASYLATVQDYYEFKIEVLMRLHQQEPTAGHQAEAFQLSEMARARSLLDSLSAQNLDVRAGVSPALLEQERVLQQRLNAKAEYQRALQKQQAETGLLTAAAQEIQRLTAELSEVRSQIKTASPRYAELTQFQPLTAAELQKSLLDQNTALLVYSLGKERSYLWFINQHEVTSYTLPARAVIEAAARQAYELLSPRRELGDAQLLSDALANLSRLVLAPAAAQLQQQRLLIVADGALQYVPFAALPAPRPLVLGLGTLPGTTERQAKSQDPSPKTKDQPLIVDHEIINLPSATLLMALRQEAQKRTAPKQTIAVLADPVFDGEDNRVAMGTAGAQRKMNYASPALAQALRDVGADNLPRLPFTRREAEAIVSLVPAAQRKTALDFAAERETFLQTNLRDYRVLHLATHGLLNSRHPELSGLVFSLVDETGKPQDGFLRLHEIYNLRLNAELVVLSACQTALGKEVRGEGLIGLTRGFMYAGATRVIASLWKVNDKATAELMKAFYQELLGAKKQSPAAALRAAQLKLLQQKRWAHPSYWAAFALQGEWR